MLSNRGSIAAAAGVLLFLLVGRGPQGTAAHPQRMPRGTQSNLTCADHPTIYSYHLHVLFLQNNASSVSRAMALQTQFYAQFGLEGKDNCTGNAGDPFNKGDMVLCAFDTAWDADGPFPTAQYSFFVPPTDLQPTLTFMTQYRNGLDVLLHPNSGCEVEDHTQWMYWSGMPWRLDISAFHCESPGCVPPS